MLSSLSRRGSRVQLPYVCYSCLTTLHPDSNILPSISGGRVTTTTFRHLYVLPGARHKKGARRRLAERLAQKYEAGSTETAIAEERRKGQDAFKEEADGNEIDDWERELKSLRAASVIKPEPKPEKKREQKPEPKPEQKREQKQEHKALKPTFSTEELEILRVQLTADHIVVDKPSAKIDVASQEHAGGGRLMRHQGKRKGNNDKSNEVGEASGVMALMKETVSASSNIEPSVSKPSRRSKLDGNTRSALSSPKTKSRNILSRRKAMLDARKLRTGSGKEGEPEKLPTSEERLQNVISSVRKSARLPADSPSNGGAKGKLSGSVETINIEDLEFNSVNRGLPPVPRLSYGLDRVLFNPGVYQLQDPRSRVYNFDPYLQEIMPISQFDFTLLKRFITSSRDQTLLQMTKAQGKKYTGSTSSMTSALTHFHYLLSHWRPINVGNLTKDFNDESSNFTVFQRIPNSMFLRWRDGVYAIDADKQYDFASVLSMLGQSMEKLLTLSTEEFERYRKDSSDTVSEESRNESEAYHYSTMGDFLMRSQLDAYDPRIPGSGMFDLKTRAVVSIRMDTDSYEKGRGYEIRSRHGQWESFEREYYDMIRSAFMKYSLQVRMGRMDGIFVAFHNTERIFGFQYISLPEMDLALHGSEDTTLGDAEFKASLELLNRVLDRATAKWPEQSLQLLVETRGKEDAPTYMYIFAKPIEEASIEKIQSSNRAQIEEFESRVLGLSKEEPESPEEDSLEWETLQASVENSMSRDVSDPGNAVDLESDREGVDIEENTPSSPWNDNVEEERGTEQVADVSEAEQQPIETSKDQDTKEATIGHRIWSAVKWFKDGKTVEALQETAGESVDVLKGVSTESSSVVLTGGAQEYSVGKEPSPEFVDEDSIIEGQQLQESSNNVSIHAPSDTEGVHHAESATEATPTPPSGTSDKPGSELLAMYLTIRNKVNGQVVKRPENLQASDSWTIEYALADISNPEKAASLYKNCKQRRSIVHMKKHTSSNGWNTEFLRELKKYTARGRAFRRRENKQQADKPVQVVTIIPEDLKNFEKWNESGRSQKVQGDSDS
jgi:hypothetical protein